MDPTNFAGAVRRARKRAVPQSRAAFARGADHAELPAGRGGRQQRHRFRPQPEDRLRAELGYRHPARIDARHGARSSLCGQPRHRPLAPGQYQRDQYLRKRLRQRVQDGAEQPGAGARLCVARPGLHVRQPRQLQPVLRTARTAAAAPDLHRAGRQQRRHQRPADRAGTGRRAGQRDRHQRRTHDAPDRGRQSDQPVPGQSDPDHRRRQHRSQRRQHQLSRPAGGIEAPHVQGPAVPGQLRVEPLHLQRAEPGHRAAATPRCATWATTNRPRPSTFARR